ncbi:hypothetical protein PXD04_08265 [Methanosphaera sp. ISO3-F5]|uniref:hypothetical protein n=1 Tax=Methanosphaera sp. ISO3-F5 TaxID=1452353 RepID=UPI002B25AA46|nr:hypothetical protein [Methanosphaera sp. ISO3-F5]WQH63687.1 hypothetical protein PXD04_08265 [Methanosphaera sp. ISO3-F5]
MKSFKIILCLLFTGLLMTNVCAYNDAPPGDWMVINGVLTNGTYNTTDLTRNWDSRRDVTVEVSNLVYVYNDGISQKYKGDSGLSYAMFNDSKGCCYHMSKDLVRGIAFATKYKFDIKKFSTSCYRNTGNQYEDPEDFYKINEEIRLENGTVIKPLSIDQDLTREQKTYFDDYQTQLVNYYQEKEIKALEENTYWTGKVDTGLDVSNRIASKSKTSGSFHGYTSNGGYLFGRYN